MKENKILKKKKFLAKSGASTFSACSKGKKSTSKF
jgi:hypothetical protein